MQKRSDINKDKSDKVKCKHENAYYFHENAPGYCPDCKQYPETLSKISNTEKDYSIHKRCGTCKYYGTSRGYECLHAGPYGGDLNPIRHPYCKWTLPFREKIKLIVSALLHKCIQFYHGKYRL